MQEGGGLGYALLADARSMAEAAGGGEVTVAYVDLSVEDEEDAELLDSFPGNTFRCVTGEIASIEVNLNLANLLKALLPIVLMSLTGLVVGWRINSGAIDALHGYLLMIAFSFAMIWIGVLLGSVVGTPEGVTGIAFAVLFPITFIASTFVPTSTMPGVLRTFAEWNPISSLATGLREQFGNPGTEIVGSAPWPVPHPVPYTLIWIVGITIVCAPLAIRAYQRSIAD